MNKAKRRPVSTLTHTTREVAIDLCDSKKEMDKVTKIYRDITY